MYITFTYETMSQQILPKILFVDDEDRILQGLKRMLRPLSSSYELLFASSADEALKIICKEKINIICSDMKMPQKDGAQLLAEIQNIAPSTIRLVLSGQAEESHILRALPYAHQYLPKPCDAINLRETIENVSYLSTKLPNAKIRESILRIRAIPSSKNVLVEFLALLGNTKPSVEDLAELAKMDIGISTKILHLISCGFLRAKTTACSMTEAIKIVGIDILKRLVDEYPIFYHPTDTESIKLLEHINELAVLLGISLEEYSRTENFPAPELNYLRGLSLLSGRIILATEYPTLYTAYFTQNPKQRSSLIEFEKNAFGLSTLAISAAINYLWGVTRIFEGTKGEHQPIPNLIAMIEQREKQLFGNLA